MTPGKRVTKRSKTKRPGSAAMGQAARRSAGGKTRSEAIEAPARARAKSGRSKPRYLPEELAELYKPVKKPVTLRLDGDILEWFQRDGRGYQTRINRALRTVMMRARA